jgi:hypothetical protein
VTLRERSRFVVLRRPRDLEELVLAICIANVVASPRDGLDSVCGVIFLTRRATAQAGGWCSPDMVVDA